MSLITVFARREPTHDSACKALERVRPGSTRKLRDVAIYRDADCTKLMGRFGPDAASRPHANSRHVMLNCYHWALQWLPPLGAVQRS